MIARLILRRLFLGLVTVWTMSILVFFGIELLPGDVADAMLGQLATPETLQAIRDDLALERPAYVRYLAWLRGFITGDLGRALATGRPIFDLMAFHGPMTLLLGSITAFIAVPLAVSLGLIAAMYPGSPFDRTVTTITLMILSGPEFLIATLLVIIFAVELRWVPAVAYFPVDPTKQEVFRALFLPVLTLTLVVLAPMIRMTRSALLNVMTSPAIQTALLKGVPRRRIVLVHTLPNAVAPIANVVAGSLAYLFTGVIIVEVIFTYPGLAKVFVDAVGLRDIPLVQTCAMLFCTIYVWLYLLADVIAIVCNPRLRFPK